MAKRESSFTNMVVTLVLVTGIAAAALGVVYDFTKGPIEAAKLKAQTEAIKNVLPEFDELGETVVISAPEGGEDSLEFFPAYKNGELVGTAIKTYSKSGFSGFISIMTGIDQDGNFSGYSVLEHAETPGLGSKMDSWFRTDKGNQNVIGKNPESTDFTVSKDGGEIDAITASTITSRAFLDAMRRAYTAYQQNDITTGNAGQ